MGVGQNGWKGSKGTISSYKINNQKIKIKNKTQTLCQLSRCLSGLYNHLFKEISPSPFWPAPIWTKYSWHTAHNYHLLPLSWLHTISCLICLEPRGRISWMNFTFTLLFLFPWGLLAYFSWRTIIVILSKYSHS